MIPRADTDELEYMRRLLFALGARHDLRLWRQNVGTVLVRDESGNVQRAFRAGAPKGAADLSGIVIPEGWRLEIETKAKRGKRSAEQISWAAFIERSGGVYALATYDARIGLDQSIELGARAVDQSIAERRKRP